MAYLWLKCAHLVSIIAWMAGVFYYPRLLVYHSMVRLDSNRAKMLGVMENKLFKIIMLPSLVLSWFSGVFLAIEGGFFSTGWLHLKLLAVVLLVVFQFYMYCCSQSLQRGIPKHSEKFFRVSNEIPTLLLIVIIISVVIQPF